MAPQSPTVAAWELAVRLKQRREQRGGSVAAISDSVGITRNYWTQIENEHKVPAPDKLKKIFDVLEFDEAEQRELTAIREIAKSPRWWEQYTALINKALQKFYGLEYGAEAIRAYENLLIPGLLQTPDYARALIEPHISVRRAEIDQRVEVRMRRQERLTDDDPMHFTALISEAALAQHAVSPKIRRGQLQHLVTMAEEHVETIDVRILPFTASSCDIFGASTFYLLDFESPRLPTLAWRESVTDYGTIEDQDAVRDLNLTFGEALNKSLSPDESVRLIQRYAKEIGP